MKAVSRRSSTASKKRSKPSLQAIKDAGYKAGKDIYLALDPAASEFYDGNSKYTFKKSTGETVSGEELVDFYAKLVRQISDRLHRGRLR